MHCELSGGGGGLRSSPVSAPTYQHCGIGCFRCTIFTHFINIPLPHLSSSSVSMFFGGCTVESVFDMVANVKNKSRRYSDSCHPHLLTAGLVTTPASADGRKKVTSLTGHKHN